MEIEIKSFDMREATQDDYAAYHEIRKDILAYLFPDDPPMDDATLETLIESRLEEGETISYIAIDKENHDSLVALARIYFLLEGSPSYEGNEHICRLSGPVVLPQYQRKGVAKKLLESIVKEALRRKTNVLLGAIFNEGGKEFLRKLGGKPALESREYRLELSDVDWSMVEKWQTDGKACSPDAEIKFATQIPESIIERYCEVYTEVRNQAPRDELEVGDTVFTADRWRDNHQRFDKQGIVRLTAYILESNGNISGLTDVDYVPSMVPLLSQVLTGVQKGYRGNGRGKWLKAAMLLEIKDRFQDIETIVTGNATSNEPMLAINERLGFKISKETTFFQVEIPKLKQYLEMS